MAQSHDTRYAIAVDPRAPILETIRLGCACGVELTGGVRPNGMKAVVALFWRTTTVPLAHHDGVRCPGLPLEQGQND